MNPGKVFAFLICVVTARHVFAAEDAARRGELIYQQRCLICHGAEGRGVPALFPPLAGSEWLTRERERCIRALCEGLSGRVQVNGADFDGSMPAQAINDAESADVLNYVGTAWGNRVAAFTADEIKQVRAKTKFPTFEVLAKASTYQPLPQPPKGYEVKEILRLPEGEFGSRLAGDGK